MAWKNVFYHIFAVPASNMFNYNIVRKVALNSENVDTETDQ